MICLTDLMLVILYMLLCILVVVFIILGIKLFTTVEKLNKTIDGVNNHLSSFDGMFSFVGSAGNYFNAFGEKIIGFLTDKLTKKKGEKEDE